MELKGTTVFTEIKNGTVFNLMISPQEEGVANPPYSSFKEILLELHDKHMFAKIISATQSNILIELKDGSTCNLVPDTSGLGSGITSRMRSADFVVTGFKPKN